MVKNGMQLEAKSRYALISLKYLNIEKYLPLESIAIKQGLPIPYLKTIFCKLSKHGLVKTLTGQQGGYKLAIDASEISLWDVMKALNEKIEMTQCKGKGTCISANDENFCENHLFWKNLENKVTSVFSQISLKDIQEISL